MSGPEHTAEKDAAPDPRLALVTAAIHLRRHPAHPHYCRCDEFAQAALDVLGGPDA